MAKSKGFIPDWTEEAPPAGSYRSIFKWGAPNGFKHPSNAWYEMMKREFHLIDADFFKKQEEGHAPVVMNRPTALSAGQIEQLKAFVGPQNVALDDYSRVKFAYGKTTEEMLELRQGIVREVADVVVHPRDKHDVRKIVEYCNAERIPVTVFSAGSSVNFGCRPAKGGVSLVVSTHMNKLLEVSELNQTARVQPGMFGPAYEEALNRSPELFNTRHSYTCGHFPQSFEYSTVGGWVVTLGSGQASTYYGDAYDIVFSQEYVTPVGTFKTLDFPATATGPKVNDIMKGSEGTFGILVEVTMKIFRYMPENRARFSFMYPTWEAAVNASREIMQSEFGNRQFFGYPIRRKQIGASSSMACRASWERSLHYAGSCQCNAACAWATWRAIRTMRNSSSANSPELPKSTVPSHWAGMPQKSGKRPATPSLTCARILAITAS
jgi:alkyldihydroxyacetonephosphate synthase